MPDTLTVLYVTVPRIEGKRFLIAISQWTVEQPRVCIFVPLGNPYLASPSIYLVVHDQYRKRLNNYSNGNINNINANNINSQQLHNKTSFY